MYKIVLMRHGESQWNLENRFTGWVDVDLTEKGREEAARAGEILRPRLRIRSLLYLRAKESHPDIVDYTRQARCHVSSCHP